MATNTGAQAIDKPAKLIVGFPPGGSIDLVARLLAAQIKGYAPSVVVDNKAGGGGRIALDAVKASPPDGSTFILTPASMMIIYPHVFKTLSYDPFKDFEPIAPVCTISLAIAVGPKVPESVKTLADLVGWMKANPKEASLGYTAQGSTQNFTAVLFARGAGITLTEVPYKGGAPAVQDLLAGQIAASIAVPSTLAPHAAAGKLRVLATTGSKRETIMPDVPTFSEAGFKDIVIEEWFGVFAAARTPEPVLTTLHQSISEAAQTKDVQDALAKASLAQLTATRANFASRMKSDHDRWASIVKSSGYKPED